MDARAHLTLRDLMQLREKAFGFSLLPQQPPGSGLAGRHAARLRGRGLDFLELRRYQQGDDVRSIDWGVTARLRVPFVRIYAEERDRVVLLLLDQRLSMFFGSRRATKAVVAAEAAALAAWRVLRAGDRVAAILFNDHEQVVIRPGRGISTIQRILSEASRLNRALRADGGLSDPSQLNRCLNLAAKLAPHNWLVVLISDVAGADDNTTRLVSTIAVHNDVVALFVSDPLEASLPAVGRVVLAEGQARLEVDIRSASLRSDFAQDFAVRREAVDRFCRHREIPVLDLFTDSDVGEQIRAALQRRVRP